MTIAVEASLLAPPERPVRLGITLVEPEFDFTRFQSAGEEGTAALIAEREAQLAPYQDPIEERLLERGGLDISRFWLVNMMSGTLPARFVAEVPCWPAVVRVELEDEYWDVAYRFMDTPMAEPAYVGWRSCTDDEFAELIAATDCQ